MAVKIHGVMVTRGSSPWVTSILRETDLLNFQKEKKYISVGSILQFEVKSLGKIY